MEMTDDLAVSVTIETVLGPGWKVKGFFVGVTTGGVVVGALWVFAILAGMA